VPENFGHLGWGFDGSCREKCFPIKMADELRRTFTYSLIAPRESRSIVEMSRLFPILAIFSPFVMAYESISSTILDSWFGSSPREINNLIQQRIIQNIAVEKEQFLIHKVRTLCDVREYA